MCRPERRQFYTAFPGATRRDELKRIQRRVLRRVLGGLKSHPAAMGFERGRSIVDNARPHAGAAVVLVLDLVDFFPSIRASRLDGLFRRCG